MKIGNTNEVGGGSGISRAVARFTGGITGKGGKNVAPIYKESIPPLPQGAPKVKYSANVTVTPPGIQGRHMTASDWSGRLR